MSSEAASIATGGAGIEAFVARQPVLDRQKRLFAYELLFRSGFTNCFDHANADQASLRVIADSQMLFGMDRLTGGKPAFINFTRDTLLQGYATILPPKAVVVEVLEDVTPDDAVITSCRQLKDAGYVLALDDFVLDDLAHPLIPLADIIKVDFRASTPAARHAFVNAVAGRKIRLLAEKVETPAEFAEALGAGFSYFQGYFFSKPEILSRQDVPSFKLTYLELLREVNRLELDRDRLEALIARDVGLLYKLLRLVNSTALGLRRRIDSIGQAMALLGDVTVRKWVSILALATIARDKPLELAVQSVTRGTFCEGFGALAGLAGRSQDLFLLGLFSLLDAIIGRPLAELLQEVAIADEVRLALLGTPGPLRDVYDCAVAYEGGDWASFSGVAAKLGVDESHMPALYLKAVEHGASLTGAGVS